jgi:hypothetical protein
MIVLSHAYKNSEFIFLNEFDFCYLKIILTILVFFNSLTINFLMFPIIKIENLSINKIKWFYEIFYIRFQLVFFRNIKFWI